MSLSSLRRPFDGDDYWASAFGVAERVRAFSAFDSTLRDRDKTSSQSVLRFAEGSRRS
jgi:hypothetical protein